MYENITPLINQIEMLKITTWISSYDIIIAMAIVMTYGCASYTWVNIKRVFEL